MQAADLQMIARKDVSAKSAICVASSGPFREWAAKLAKSQKIPLSALVERSLIEVAKSSGFPDPAPDRY